MYQVTVIDQYFKEGMQEVEFSFETYKEAKEFIDICMSQLPPDRIMVSFKYIM